MCILLWTCSKNIFARSLVSFLFITHWFSSSLKNKTKQNILTSIKTPKNISTHLSKVMFLSVVICWAMSVLDLTEAGYYEEVTRIHRRITQKKNFSDPDNHDGVTTYQEPDILECELKWALGSITTNKASGRDGIPVDLFQILKDDAMKVLHSICQQFRKLSSGHRTGKGQFSFQSQRKAMPKNVQTTTKLHSFHTLTK